MKEHKNISKLNFYSKMVLHKVIFAPITAAQGNLHFYELYVYFWTPLSSHIGISKISTPKTLLSQRDFSRVIRSILKNLSYSVIYLQGYISKMGLTDFSYWAPARRIKSPKLDPRRIFLHRENIISASAAYFQNSNILARDQPFLSNFP